MGYNAYEPVPGTIATRGGFDTPQMAGILAVAAIFALAAFRRGFRVGVNVGT